MRRVPELLGQGGAGVVGHVGDDQPGALTDERARDGGALALGAAGDDGVLVLETGHALSLEGEDGVGGERDVRVAIGEEAAERLVELVGRPEVVWVSNR